MNRRKTLKALAASSIGIAAVGYWAVDSNTIQDLLSDSFFKPSEQDLLTSITDTIIPRTDKYGAVDLGVPIYLLSYLEHCEPKEVNDNIKQQLKSIQKKANKDYRKDFNDCDSQQRKQILLSLAQSASEGEKNFFELIKKQVIHGFKTSQEVMTNHYDYQIAPGYYNGCLTIESKPSNA